MTDADNGEIYRQRYETFRHIDRLRWQMFQIALGAGSVILTFSGGSKSPPTWAWIIVGIVLLLFACIMARMNRGVADNNVILHAAGLHVGDDGIPQPGGWKSTANITALVLGIAAIACMFKGICDACVNS